MYKIERYIADETIDGEHFVDVWVEASSHSQEVDQLAQYDRFIANGFASNNLRLIND